MLTAAFTLVVYNELGKCIKCVTVSNVKLPGVRFLYVIMFHHALTRCTIHVSLADITY